MGRNLDLVLFGASGFTGRLVAEYLQRRLNSHVDLRWALAGRDAAKLAQVRDAIGADPGLPLLTADAADAAAMAELVRQARVVITTVGPYQRYGEALITACAQAGTDYVDLCGEPLWMAKMIPALQPPAQASGARIVFSCGFDSIPFDLGVVFLQSEMQRRLGVFAQEVRSRVTVMKGTLSGGTAASALATFEQIGRERDGPHRPRVHERALATGDDVLEAERRELRQRLRLDEAEPLRRLEVRADRLRLQRQGLLEPARGAHAAGDRLDESLVKDLTGGDRIRARQPHGRNFEFTPTHHIWMATNHLPRITGTDTGIWRRIRLVPFTAAISDEAVWIDCAESRRSPTSVRSASCMPSSARSRSADSSRPSMRMSCVRSPPAMPWATRRA